jgi:FdhD protein
VSESFRAVDRVRVDGGAWRRGADLAAVEEPLQVCLNGEPFAVIMRTPGADVELAAGFLLSERVIAAADELGTIEHCARAGSAGARNLVDVRLTGAAASRLPAVLADRRQVTAVSACGLCGRKTIDSLRSALPRLPAGERFAASILCDLPRLLGDSQAAFRETGGLHAAGLFDLDGRLALVREDVGRHNAVDKVVGAMLLDDRLPLADHVLFVSGRSSFEIVQKAFIAGIPIVASVSAPSTLAIDLAAEAGITLVGFVRGSRFNVYTHASRLAGASS